MIDSFLGIKRSQPSTPSRILARPSKKGTGKKIGGQKHLSPSRRRALPREIVQRPAQLQASPRPGPARAVYTTRGLHTVQRFEDLCSPVQSDVSTMCPHRNRKPFPNKIGYSIKSGISRVLPTSMGVFFGLIILWSTVRVRVGPPDTTKPRDCAAFSCPQEINGQGRVHPAQRRRAHDLGSSAKTVSQRNQPHQEAGHPARR